jgi:hypothetical protein
MKKVLVGLVVSGLLIALGYAAGTFAQKKKAQGPGFMQSTSAKIQLGVWDKFEVDNTDRTLFIVTGPNGKTYRAESSQSLDNWVYVDFPDGFSEYPDNGDTYTTYTWKALVGGKNAASGKFKWGNGQADDNNRNEK